MRYLRVIQSCVIVCKFFRWSAWFNLLLILEWLHVETWKVKVGVKWWRTLRAGNFSFVRQWFPNFVPVLHTKTETEETLNIDYHNLKGWVQREWGLSLHEEPRRKDKGQWLQIAPGEASLVTGRTLSAGRIISHWKNFLRDMMEPLLLEAFRICLDRVLDKLAHLDSPFHGRPGGVGGSLQTWTVVWFNDHIS